MSLDDSRLSESCGASILNSIEDGYVVEHSWFNVDDRVGFLDCLSQDGRREERYFGYTGFSEGRNTCQN